MDGVQKHFLSEGTIKLKSSIAEKHKAEIDALVKEHEENLELIKKYGEEWWFEKVMKLRLK